MARINSTEADIKLNPHHIRPEGEGLPPVVNRLITRPAADMIPATLKHKGPVNP